MNKHIKTILAIIAGLAWLASGCASPAASPTATITLIPSATPIPPSETPEPTNTTAPTSTPEPTATITNTPEPTATNTPDLTATKQSEATQAAELVIEEIRDELEAVELSGDTGYLLWVQDESVKIDLDEYQEWIYEPFAEDQIASDFVLKTDITWDSTSGLMTCGFYYRSEENIEDGKQYLFVMLRLSGLPAWDITYWQYNEFQSTISEMRTNSAIDQGQMSTNKIVLIAEEEKFTLYINDTRVGSFYDYSKKLMEGYFAFSANHESGESSCEFSNTWVWALK